MSFFSTDINDYTGFLDGLSGNAQESTIIPIEDWIEDPYYVGELSLWPVIRDSVIEFMTGNYCEALITGGTRSGKSFFTSTVLLRILYEISVHSSPQRIAGLNPSSKLILINLSVAGYQAEGGIYSELRNLIADSPYFRQNFPFDERVVATMRFPKRVYYIHGSGLANKDLGMNVVAGCYDEVNRATTVQKSARAKDSSGEFNQVEVRYEELSQRIRQTTLANPDTRTPFRVIALGARERADDFISKRIKLLEDDPNTYIRHFIAPETRPQEIFSKKTFFVDIGGTYDPPEIIKVPLEDHVARGKIIEVPENYRRDAETDLPSMLKLVYGIIKEGIEDKFFKDQEKVRIALSRPKISHPYTLEVEDFNFAGDFILDKFLVEKKLRNRDRPRYIHIDMAKNGCRIGFVMGHCPFTRQMYRFDEDTLQEYTEKLPVTFYDLILGIDPKGKEIDPFFIRKRVLQLRSFGFNIAKVTGDQYAFSSLLELRKMGIEVEQLSIDRNLNVQNSLKTAITDGRIVGYDYQIAKEEMLSVLEDSDGKRKKPTDGSTDVLDGMMGVNWEIQQTGFYSIPMVSTSASAGTLSAY